VGHPAQPVRIRLGGYAVHAVRLPDRPAPA
jgi:hypothetical protein